MVDRALRPRSTTNDQRSTSHKLPQHERQDPAVTVVVDFDRGVDAHAYGDVLGRAVAAVDDEGGVLATETFQFQCSEVPTAPLCQFSASLQVTGESIDITDRGDGGSRR